jgi:hypothetical protein
LSITSIYWIVFLGLIVGLVWAGVFRMAWRVFGEETRNLRLIPALAVVLIEVFLTGRRLLAGWVRALDVAGPSPRQPDEPALGGTQSAQAALILVLSVLTQWALIATIERSSPWWPSSQDWRHYFNWLYPAPIYRPLILAPLWGRWAILLAACVGRSAADADPTARSLSSLVTPGRLLIAAALPLFLNSIYFSRDGNLLLGLVAALLVFFITYLVTVLFAYRGNGQTAASMFASGQAAQLAFLAVYRALWPLVHG